MRQALHGITRKDGQVQVSSHFGLAYDMLAPPPTGQKELDVEQRQQWLDACQSVTPDPDYAAFLGVWRGSFGPDSTVFEVKCNSRLLIGHGNPSGADVGLTVHQTWGVPIIPGSSLKGLLAHFIDASYGSDAGDDAERSWRGSTWEGRTVPHGKNAGRNYAALFGKPPSASDPQRGDGASTSDTDALANAGCIVFHDALWSPRQMPPESPFALDVLTVHQPSYYNEKGAVWPNDWDSPNPVGFITVRPGTRFLVALTCTDMRDPQVAQEWLEFTRDQLLQALDRWGIGGKTAAGYGRMVKV